MVSEGISMPKCASEADADKKIMSNKTAKKTDFRILSP
jgi:hypothetical protein